MLQKIIIKNTLLGFLSWLIPFVISFLFYKPGGELIFPYATFKTTIMFVGVLSGCYLLFRFFKFIDSDFVRNGVIVGLTWFAINIVLDTIILIPIMKTSFAEYFMSIGLGYFSLPITSITMGYLLHSKIKQQ